VNWFVGNEVVASGCSSVEVVVVPTAEDFHSQKVEKVISGKLPASRYCLLAQTRNSWRVTSP